MTSTAWKVVPNQNNKFNTAFRDKDQSMPHTKKKRNPKKKLQPSSLPSHGHPGCFIAHFGADWLLGVEDLIQEDFEDEIPDLAFDPELRILTVINSQDYIQSYFITIGMSRSFCFFLFTFNCLKFMCITFVIPFRQLLLIQDKFPCVGRLGLLPAGSSCGK